MSKSVCPRHCATTSGPRPSSIGARSNITITDQSAFDERPPTSTTVTYRSATRIPSLRSGCLHICQPPESSGMKPTRLSMSRRSTSPTYRPATSAAPGTSISPRHSGATHVLRKASTLYLSNTRAPECTNASTSSLGYSEAMSPWSEYFERSEMYHAIASSVAPRSQSHHKYLPGWQRSLTAVSTFRPSHNSLARSARWLSVSCSEYWSISYQLTNIASNCDWPRRAASYSR